LLRLPSVAVAFGLIFVTFVCRSVPDVGWLRFVGTPLLLVTFSFLFRLPRLVLVALRFTLRLVCVPVYVVTVSRLRSVAPFSFTFVDFTFRLFPFVVVSLLPLRCSTFALRLRCFCLLRLVCVYTLLRVYVPLRFRLRLRLLRSFPDFFRVLPFAAFAFDYALRSFVLITFPRLPLPRFTFTLFVRCYVYVFYYAFVRWCCTLRLVTFV